MKYWDPRVNPNLKPVILYAPNYIKAAEEEMNSHRIVVARTEDELSEMMLAMRKHACVDIAWDDELEKHWCAPIESVDDTPKSFQEYEDELALREELRTELGAEPGAAIIVDCISTKQSRRLAWRLLPAMFEQWPPCVLRSYWTGPDPIAEEIWTPNELAMVWAETGRLP